LINLMNLFKDWLQSIVGEKSGAEKRSQIKCVI